MRVVRVPGAAALALPILTIPWNPVAVAEPPSAAVSTEKPEKPEQDASVRARRENRPVEVESMRSETRQVFADPDGTFTLEQHVRPVRVRKDGAWAPVDTTLRLRPDGAVEPVATAAGMTFSGGGDAPLARLSRGAKSLALGWPDPLPKPTLKGDTATYAEVMPGVDLQVTADVDGFSHVLVVKSRAAAAGLPELVYPLSAKGLSVRKDEAGSDVDAAPTVRALSRAAPRLNEWTHLAGGYDSATGQISLYVNGRLESTADARPWAATGPLTIGRGKSNGAAADFWPGDIDEVRVYGRAMFADEVANLVNSAATLVGHWKLNEDTGTTAADTAADTAAAVVRVRSDAVAPALECTHVAGVYDPLAGRLRIYVNGRLSATTSTDLVSTWNASGLLQLGRTKIAGVFTGYWPGIIDDVRTYDGVLSAEQIAQLAAQ